MHKVERSALVGYSIQQMYDLINDIESYPEFLPWCKEAEVFSKSDTVVVGSLTIVKGPFKQAVKTQNHLVLNRCIDMQLLDGPFKYFNAIWLFDPLEVQSCRVTFSTQFSFKSKILDIGLGKVFDHIANAMLDAFCQRAKALYG